MESEKQGPGTEEIRLSDCVQPRVSCSKGGNFETEASCSLKAHEPNTLKANHEELAEEKARPTFRGRAKICQRCRENHAAELEKAKESSKTELDAAIETERKAHVSARVLEAEVAAQAAELKGVHAQVAKLQSDLKVSKTEDKRPVPKLKSAWPH